MTNEKNELIFMRCPSCRSLVPTGSVKCRMCGFAFESADADSASAARTSGRVRQRTVSKSREEILAALEQAEHGGQRESALPEETPAAMIQADTGDDNEFANETESIEEQVQPEPAYANGHHEGEYQAEAQEEVQEEQHYEESPQEEVREASQEEAEPAGEDYAAAEHEVMNVPEEHFETVHVAEEVPETQEFAVTEDVVEEEQYQEEATEIAAHELTASDEVVEEQEFAVEQESPSVHYEAEHSGHIEEEQAVAEDEEPQQVLEAQVEEQHEPEEPVVEVAPEQIPDRPAANIPPKSHREHDSGFRLRGDERTQKQGGNQPGYKGGQQMSHDGNRDENRSQHGGQQQHGGRHNQPGQRGNQGQNERNDRDRGRQQDSRNQDNRQKDRDNRRQERDQHQGGHPNQPPRHRHDDARGKRTEVRSPVSEDALIGWFVSYDSPGGASTELRGSKFFITREQIRATDLVIADQSVSSPHCLVSSTGSGTLILQDLLSENGISVKRAGSGSFENLDESDAVSSGDTVRFGSAEFLVVLLP